MAPPPGPTIRRLTTHDDLDAFGAVLVRAYRALPGHPSDGGYDEHLRDVGSRVATDVVLGAFVDGRPAGCVTFVADASSPHAEGLVEGESSFRMLAVDPERGGAGIGAALVRRCLALAAERGSHGVFVSSGDWMSTAHRLYERLGFVRAPERDWSPGGGVRLLGFRRPVGGEDATGA